MAHATDRSAAKPYHAIEVWLAQAVREPMRLASFSAGALLSLVMVYCMVRAARESITHDEAITYANYVAAPPHWLVTHFDVNNHLLNSLLCRVTTAVFGVSEFTLRLPALLGAALYLFGAYRLARNLSSAAAFLLAVALLALCPLVLDYLAIARGYGLALAGLTLGLSLLLDYLADLSSGTDNALGRSRLYGASIALSLAVYANLTSAIPVALLAFLFAWLVKRRQRQVLSPVVFQEYWREFRGCFFRPAICFAGVLLIFVIKARPHHFYFGEESLLASLQGLVAASVTHHGMPYGLPGSAVVAKLLLGLTWVLCGAIVVGLVGRLAWQARGLSRAIQITDLDRQQRLLLLASGTLLGSWGLWIVLHFVGGMKYPCERTGVFSIPLFLISAVALISSASVTGAGWAAAGRRSATVALAGLLAIFVAQWPATYFRTWHYDCASRDVAQSIRQAAAAHDESQRTIVRCNWVYRPALEFYFRLWNCDQVDVRSDDSDQSPPTFLVMSHTERETWLTQYGPAQLLLESGRSGCIVTCLTAANDSSLHSASAEPASRPAVSTMR